MPHIPGDPEAGHRNIRPGGGGNVRPSSGNVRPGGRGANVRPSAGNVRPSPTPVPTPTVETQAPESDGLLSRVADTVLQPAGILAAPALIAEAISPGNPFSGFVRNIGTGIRETAGNIVRQFTPVVGDQPLLERDLSAISQAESVGDLTRAQALRDSAQDAANQRALKNRTPPDFLNSAPPTSTAEQVGRGIGTGLANIPVAGSGVPEENFISNRARNNTSPLETALINLEVATLPIAHGVSPAQIGNIARLGRATVGARATRNVRPSVAKVITEHDIITGRAGTASSRTVHAPIEGTNQSVEFTPPSRTQNARPTPDRPVPVKTPNTAREAATERVDRRVAAQDRATKSPLVTRAIQAIKDTKIVRRATTELISEQRPARVARGIAASEGGDILTRSRRFRGAQRGEFETFQPDDAIRGLFTDDEFRELVGMIRDPDIFNPVSQAFQMNNADTAFQKLFSENLLPTEGEITLLEEVFGGKFVRATMAKRTLPRKVWATFLDAWNLPRAFIASGDVSGTLRQAGMLAAGNPRRFGQANAAQYRAAVSKRGFLIEKELIESNPNFQRFTRKQAGPGIQTKPRLQLTSTSGASPLNAREEVYLSGFSDNIPVIRNSQRAFVTLLNKLRMDVMDDMIGLIESSGRAATEVELDDAARFINNATGRGPLPVPQDVAAIFNGVFFSSKLFTSRIALPFSVISRSGTIRKKVAKDLVKAVGTIMTMEMVLKYSGAAEVESDPRSSDFGKMKFGKLRIDPWMGFQKIARLVAQLSTGDRKSVGTGGITHSDFLSRETLDTVATFLRAMLHPSAGAVVSTLDGEDFLGDDFSEAFKQPFLGKGVQTPSDLLDIRKNPVVNGTVFLFVQDMMDAIAEQGFVSGLGAGTAGFIGFGASTFSTPDDLAKDIHGVGFTEIYPFEQTEVRAIFNAQEDDTPEILNDGTINPDLSRSRQLDIERMNKLTELSERAASTPTIAVFAGQKTGRRQIVNDYFAIKAENAIRKNEARENLFGDTDYQQDSRGTPLEKAALQEYYNAIDESKSPAGIFLNDVWQQKRDDLTRKWQDEGTLLYVQANTNTKPVPKRLEDFLRVRARNEWQRIQDSKDARTKLSARPRGFEPVPSNTSVDVPIRPTGNVRPSNSRSRNVRPGGLR